MINVFLCTPSHKQLPGSSSCIPNADLHAVNIVDIGIYLGAYIPEKRESITNNK